MIEHIARFPSLRDRALFVGNPDDIVPERSARAPADDPRLDRATLRVRRLRDGLRPGRARRPRGAARELGYGGRAVCIVSVGGSGVGGDLLRRVIAAYPRAKQRVPELRMIVVAGPRIDPASLPQPDGLEVRAYVHNLYRTWPPATSPSSRAG
jgi:hypothetical protein